MQTAKVLESVSNSQVKHLVKLRNDKVYRKEKNSVMVLGAKVYEELAKSDAPIRGVYYTNAYKPLLKHLKKREIQLFQVNDEIIHKISGVKGDAEGIVTEVELPVPLDHRVLSQPIKESSPFVLILDRIQDPGNLGTLIRTATALNWTGVYITPSSVDPFNDKAIRAARGATFRIPLIYDVPVAEVKKQFEKNKQQWRILIADAKGKDINSVIQERQSRWNKGIALVLGSEARGVSGDWNFSNQTTESIGIPMSGNQESLNVAVAGGILMEKLVNKTPRLQYVQFLFKKLG